MAFTVRLVPFSPAAAAAAEAIAATSVGCVSIFRADLHSGFCKIISSLKKIRTLFHLRFVDNNIVDDDDLL